MMQLLFTGTTRTTRNYTTVTNLVMCLLGCLLLVGCASTPAPKAVAEGKKTVTTPFYQPLKLNPTHSVIDDNPNLWAQQYKDWYQLNNLDAPYSYVQFLKKQRTIFPPLDQLMRSALSYERCGESPYSLPYYEIWPNILPTIDLLNELQQLGILYNFEITSGYRSPSLNECVGGARASKHMLNSALDIHLLGEQESSYGQFVTKQRLCEFWGTEGARYNMGLGVYKSGIIHIDTQGWRTWGPNYSASSSICATPLPNSEPSIF